jgi:hypothetical protein
MEVAPDGETPASAPSDRVWNGASESIASHRLSLGERSDGQDSRALVGEP